MSSVSKVVFGNTTVMDITDSTVTASKLKSGETAYAANGAKITGELVVPEVLDDLSDVTINTPANAHEIYYDGSQWINYGAKILLTFDDAFQGQTITLSKGQTVITKVAPLTGNSMSLYISETGEWTISSTIDQETYETVVTITAFGITYTAELSSVPPIPEGATVTPTDDIQIWLACASITDKAYTTLAEVLADRETFETLIADSNACDYMARSTTWALAEGSVPQMTSDTTPSGVASVGNTTTYSGFEAYKAFDGSTNTCWLTGDNPTLSDVWIKYDFGTSKTIVKAKLGVTSYGSNAQFHIKGFTISGSNDDSTYTDLLAGTTTSNSSGSTEYFNFTSIGNYRYYKLKATSNWYSSGLAYSLGELQFYEADITADKDAMALIGKYDYCSNALLGNATWVEAIANSDYFESVLNVKVPIMTSNTTPSGQAVASSEYSSTYAAWKAFDNNDSTYWNNNGTTAIGTTIGYYFTTSVLVKKVVFKIFYATIDLGAFKLQGSNDGTNWYDVATQSTAPTTNDFTFLTGTNDTPYSKWRIYVTSVSGNNRQNVALYSLQFYGRASKEVLVPLVPTMTSNTTPSGECICSGYATNQEAYKAFDSNDSTTWSNNNATYAGAYIGYKFSSSVKVDKIVFTKRNLSGYGTGACTAKIQGSNDNSTWVDLTSTLSFEQINTSTTGDTIAWNVTQNSGKYLYYRLYYLTYEGQAISGGLNPTTAGLQFYAKTVQTNIVHSCANDTIYYMDEGSPVIVATTNSDGDGILDFSSLEDGTYTFYSSVAKDPSNLSNDYSKVIRITNSRHGGTTEMYLMPDAVKTLYWWGYESSDLEDMSTANGWENHSSPFSWVAPTRSTNKINISCSASNQTCGIASKVKVPANYIKIIYQSVQTGQVSWYYVSTTTKAWNSETSQFGKSIPISSVMAFGNQATGASSDCYVGLATTTGTRSTDIYAFYYE